jgi:hypothetical protein
MNNTRKTTKQIFAIRAAVPATAPKPRTAATSAIIKNRIVLFNIFCLREYERRRGQKIRTEPAKTNVTGVVSSSGFSWELVDYPLRPMVTIAP